MRAGVWAALKGGVPSRFPPPLMEHPTGGGGSCCQLNSHHHPKRDPLKNEGSFWDAISFSPFNWHFPLRKNYESSSWMAKEKEAERMTLLERKLLICRIWMTENKYFMDDDSALFIPEADRRDLKPASIKSHLQCNQKNLVVALLVRGL